ncbi:MAG: DNA alkylation repair protein, partial [Planctomycetaceae bacterium]|nr:DNA alkylation repair protein [Planctomycetaceae bacterium]
ELKQRMRHITHALHEFLPNDYGTALTVLERAAPSFGGFEAMFFPDFVEVYGLSDWDRSLQALEHFTKYSSSEFAVRPFIAQDQQRMVRQLKLWAASPNEHVRRLASEGSRPRLPWAMALPAFKQNPAPMLPILKRLKADPSEYVRRSVANHLNDISKDHPDVVLSLAEQWLTGKPETRWIVKHGCRTLLKQGDSRTLALFGYRKPEDLRIRKFQLQPSVISMGEQVEFEFELVSRKTELGQIRLEYAVEFVRLKGATTRKVFKISEGIYSEHARWYRSRHSFKPISTRNYYPGTHRLAIIVNGQEMEQAEFELQAG